MATRYRLDPVSALRFLCSGGHIRRPRGALPWAPESATKSIRIGGRTLEIPSRYVAGAAQMGGATARASDLGRGSAPDH
ncbi:MAG: hypothetical protein WCP04_14335 [Pseudomonadota bacterium]